MLFPSLSPADVQIPSVEGTMVRRAPQTVADRQFGPLTVTAASLSQGLSVQVTLWGAAEEQRPQRDFWDFCFNRRGCLPPLPSSSVFH